MKREPDSESDSEVPLAVRTWEVGKGWKPSTLVHKDGGEDLGQLVTNGHTGVPNCSVIHREPRRAGAAVTDVAVTSRSRFQVESLP